MLSTARKAWDRVRGHATPSYAALKAENEQRLLAEEAAGVAAPSALPLYVNIETTRNCNLTCPMCPFHASKEAKKRWKVARSTMPQEQFEAIAHEIFPTLHTCALTVTGDFTVTPYLMRVFDLLEQYEVRFDSFTNGALLTEDIIRRMTPLLAALTISMESPNRVAFETWRRGANWDKVMANMRTLARERDRLPADARPRLDVQAVLMRSTIEELPALVDYAANAGFDMVKGVHLVVFEDALKNESLLYHREVYNECLAEALTRAQRHGLQTHFPPPFPLDDGAAELAPHHERHRPAADGTKPPCHFVWRRSFLNYDGQTLACCAPAPPELGVYTDTTFTDVWTGPAYRELRRGHAAGAPQPPCDKCWIYMTGDNAPGTEDELLIFSE